MRLVLAAMLAAVVPAHADKARECYRQILAQPPIAMPAKLVPFGCFEQIKSTEDHAYGYRACFVFIDGVCTGMLDIYDASIEPDRALFDRVTCSKGGAVSFAVTKKWQPSFEDVGPFAVDLQFTGRVATGSLRGILRDGKQRSRVRWRKTKFPFSVLVRTVHQLEQVADCVRR